jgi:hypothetical protein
MVFSLNWLGSCLHWDHFEQFRQIQGFFQIEKKVSKEKILSTFYSHDA